MISQIGSPATATQGNAGQSAPVVVDIKPQKSVAQVELPRQAVQAADKKVDVEAAKRAAAQINEFIHQFDRNLQFIVDEATGIDVVKVIDAQSNEVIRQMPTEEMLTIARALDKLQGLLVKEKA